MTDADRGTGRTTRQMSNAAIGATFVWCNDRLEYPMALAHRLDRGDLRIVPASFAKAGDDMRLRGLKDIVVDHAYREPPN